MDPKAVSNLDPKLKETYDRVMGTATPGSPAGSAAPPAPAVAPVNADITQAQAAAPTVAPTETPQATGQPAYNADNLRFQAAIQAPAGSVPVGGAVAKIPGQTSSLLRILYIIAAIVFFVVYTFVWIKVFNLPLPF